LKPEGKVQVVVKSRRVPVGVVCRTEPVYSTTGVLLGSRPSSLVLFGTTLDEEYLRAIDEGQKLSRNLGLDLEIVDSAKNGLFRRILSSLGLSGPGRPIVMVAPIVSEAGECLPESLSSIR
jgi:hypothetical protein